jgi:hypothetical protein
MLLMRGADREFQGGGGDGGKTEARGGGMGDGAVCCLQRPRCKFHTDLELAG